MSETSSREFKILLVEDNAADVFMVREALEHVNFPRVLNVVNDGVLALNFLRENMGEHGTGLDLLILDLNLPGKGGREIMSEMQADPNLRRLPTAIFTTSHTDSAIVREFPSLRSTFAAKTPDFQELVSIVHRFKRFAEESRVDRPPNSVESTAPSTMC